MSGIKGRLVGLGGAIAALLAVLPVMIAEADGINWTFGAPPSGLAGAFWNDIAYHDGLFVAVGANDAVMTSPDGITWTSRTTSVDNDWRSVTYGDGLFVATAMTGTGNRVMTSPDGIAWTVRTSPADNTWRSVTYGNRLFVATSVSGTGNRVMTSGVLGGPPIYAPVSTDSTTTTTSTTVAPVTMQVLKVRESIRARAVASGAQIASSAGSRIAIRVSGRSSRHCMVTGRSLVGTKPGRCTVTVLVTPRVGPPITGTVTYDVVR